MSDSTKLEPKTPSIPDKQEFITDAEITQEWKREQLKSESNQDSNGEPTQEDEWLAASSQHVEFAQDIESTQEWYPPSDRPLAQTPVIEPNDDLSDLKTIDLAQLNLTSALSLTGDVLTITTPRVSWRSRDILFIVLSLGTIGLLLIGPLKVVFWLDAEVAVPLFFALTMLFWLMIIGVFVGFYRKQTLVINSEQLIYSTYLPSQLGKMPNFTLFKKNYPLDQLIEATNDFYTEDSFVSHCLVLKMQGEQPNLFFAPMLDLEERQLLAEQIHAHLIRLQKSKFSS